MPIWFIILCLSGLYHPRLYGIFSFMLLGVVSLNTTFQNILKTVNNVSSDLINIMLFNFIICYIYAIIGIFFLSEQFIKDERSEFEDRCHNLLGCFLMAIVFSSNHKPGIQINLINKSYFIDKKVFFIRFFYDLGFFYLTYVGMVNLILGVLISGFSDERRKSHEKKFDLENVCFICGGTKEKFEKKNINFEEHKSKVHNIKDYLSYFNYLRCKDRTDLNFSKAYVQEMIKCQKITIFPTFQEKDEPDIDISDKDVQELLEITKQKEEGDQNEKNDLIRVIERND